ncbi:MAG TPA: ABC transporter permease [Thermoplasmata archaeon]|nr:ABC transporter permease [Thermoplasmata archaeon]
MPAPVVGLRAAVREALRTKAGLFGFGMVGFLLALVIVVPVLAPYDVISSWGESERWSDNPYSAAPDWLDAFSATKAARTKIVEWNLLQGPTRDRVDRFTYSESNTTELFKIIQLRARWTFAYDGFPQEIRLQTLYWSTEQPVIAIEWTRPDDENVTIYQASPQRLGPNVETLSLSSMTQPFNVLSAVRQWAVGVGADPVPIEKVRPHIALFAEKGPGMMDPSRAKVLKGYYSMTITVFNAEPSDKMQARFTSFGTVFGIAGTDHLRRDLFIGLLWGAPVALAFGVAAAVITVMAQVILGALGAFYGGRTDEIIQRGTDFLIILPVLPILILIGQLYQISIVWTLLIVVMFNILGGTTKVIRTIALQVKEESYVETARSYGASRLRILFRYIMPRTMPYTFALLALSVPGFIFLEASLSFIGLGDPVLPTWGALMGDASRNGALYNGLWWWIAFPALGIVFTTIAFALLGYAFDKVLNPRLREE